MALAITSIDVPVVSLPRRNRSWPFTAALFGAAIGIFYMMGRWDRPSTGVDRFGVGKEKSAATASLIGQLMTFNVALAHDPGAEKGTPSGKSSPPDSGTRIRTTFNQSAFAGKPYLVHFWATWCGICREEKPLMMDLAKRQASEGFRMVGIAAYDQMAEVIKREREDPHSYPVGLDADGSVATALQVMGVPQSFLVAANGRICKHYLRPLQAPDVAGFSDSLAACR